MSVRDLIHQLDAAKLEADQQRRDRQRRLAELEAQAQQEQAAEAMAAAKAAQQELEQARELERSRWHVDEDASAREVAEGKAKLLAKLQHTRKPEAKTIQDVTTLVLDLGSAQIKVGMAGQDAPRYIFSSLIGTVDNPLAMDLEKHAHVKRDRYIGDTVWPYTDVLTIRPLMERGIIRGENELRWLLDYIYKEELGLTPEQIKEQPVLVTEPPFSPLKNRELLARVLFGEYQIPALFVANTSALALYASGKVTGVVVELGHSYSTSVAVYEGSVLPNTLRRLDIGGRDLDHVLFSQLQARGYNVSPQRTFDQFLVRDIKEHHCFVAYDYEAALKGSRGESKASAWARNQAGRVDYDVTSHGNADLPGFDERLVPNVLTLDEELFRCGEALFNPRDILGRTDDLIAGIHHMVSQTITSLPLDLKRDMFANIHLAGGTSLLHGLADRLRKELRVIAPPSIEIVVHDPVNRHFATWTGGSLLASTKSFNPHWIARDEYERYGVELVHATRDG